MRYFYLTVLTLLIFLCSSCTIKQDWGTFKTVSLEPPEQTTELSPAKVTGFDWTLYYIIKPSLEKAVKRALKKYPEATGLKDVEVKELYIFWGGEPRVVHVKGIPVRVSENPVQEE